MGKNRLRGARASGFRSDFIFTENRPEIDYVDQPNRGFRPVISKDG